MPSNFPTVLSKQRKQNPLWSMAALCFLPVVAVLFVFKVLLWKVSDKAPRVCVFVSVCLFLWLSVPSNRFLGSVWSHHNQTWRGDYLSMVMYHVLIMLTLTFIQSLTNLNHKNNKCYFRNCSINPHQICSEESPTKGVYNHVQFDDLALQSRSQLRLNLDKCLTCTIIAIYRTVFKLWHSNVAWR